MPSLTRLFIKDRETPSSRVRIRHETTLPVDADGANGDVCIVASGASAGVYVHTAGAWTEIGSGSPSSSAGIFSPLAQPASPNAADEEFLESGSQSALTLFDPGSLGTTITHRSGGASINIPHAGATPIWSGGRIPVPGATPWSATVCVRVARSHDTSVAVMFAAFSTDVVANPTTADMVGIDHILSTSSGAGSARVVEWSSYTTAAGTLVSYTSMYSNRTQMFMRLRYDGTTLSFDRSDDGIQFEQLWADATPYVVPAHVGIIGTSYGGTAATTSLHVPWIRFTASAARDQAVPGGTL